MHQHQKSPTMHQYTKKKNALSNQPKTNSVNKIT